MADIVDPRPGSSSTQNYGGVRYHDEGDGSFSMSEASHLWAYDASAGAYVRVAVDHNSGGLTVAGTGAGGATDAGNPVKVGGIFNTTPPTYTTGQRTDLQTDNKGSVRVLLGTANSATNVGAGGETADAITSPAAALWTGAFVNVYNGTNYDRWRGQVSIETGSVYNGLTALTPKFSTIVASASGVTQVVASVSSKKLRVLAYVLVANAAVNVKFQSHTVPTDKTGLLYLGANGGVSSGYSPNGHFETIAGEALDINLSGAVAVGGHLVYVEV